MTKNNIGTERTPRMCSDKFIQLNRCFYLLHEKDQSEDRVSEDVMNSSRANIKGTIDWTALLKEHRAVILSEAGSGKPRQNLLNRLSILLSKNLMSGGL